jgi:hypothetical protein
MHNTKDRSGKNLFKNRGVQYEFRKESKKIAKELIRFS